VCVDDASQFVFIISKLGQKEKLHAAMIPIFHSVDEDATTPVHGRILSTDFT
jgi:hypothetical protein